MPKKANNEYLKVGKNLIFLLIKFLINRDETIKMRSFLLKFIAEKNNSIKIIFRIFFLEGLFKNICYTHNYPKKNNL